MSIDLETLKDAIKITDLARQLGLQVRGKQARCFNASQHKHGDKTPSLGLDTKSNRFKCFACGVSGSVIDLYKEVKGVSVSEAISELADMAGLKNNIKQHTNPSQNHTKAHTNAGENVRKSKVFESREVGKHWIPSQQTRLNEALSGVYEALASVYEALQGYCGELDSESFAYLMGATRGLTKETIKRFGLFNIKDYPATNKFMREKFSLEQLRQAGLFNEKGNLIFYYHSLIIPFIEGGRVIFLQGRLTNSQLPVRKYMHLARSVPLYNADRLKTLKRGDKVYLCEGVFDAIMLEQNGYKAVAILGVNNFKPEMVSLFKGLDVVLCLDNDEAGKQATQGLASVFYLQGQSIKTKALPDGVKDITEYFIK